MDVWNDLERRIRERGVRVEERLALLARLREEQADGEHALAARRAALLEAVEKAADALLREEPA